MGFRTDAATKIRSLWVCMRRFSASAATGAEKKKKVRMLFDSESNLVPKKKSLYLCFREGGCTRYGKQVVRAIDDEKGSEDGDGDEKLVEAAYKRCSFNDRGPISLGSKILFHSGRHRLRIDWIDTWAIPLKFRVFSPKPTSKEMLESNAFVVIVGVVDGKLYCLCNNYLLFELVPCSYPFTVFDSKMDAWKALPTPPFLLVNCDTSYNVMFLNETKRILGWKFDIDKPQDVFCFNTTNPRNGWIGLGITFPFTAVPFFFHHHQPGFGDIYLFITYFPKTDPRTLSVSYLSNNLDAFQSIDHPILLPIDCYKYLYRGTPDASDDESDLAENEFDLFGDLSADMQFVHLGSQRFGVFLHRFARNHQGKKTGFLIYVKFKYDIITTHKDSKPTLEIRARVLETRRFKFHTNTTMVAMNGAFLL